MKDVVLAAMDERQERLERAKARLQEAGAK